MSAMLISDLASAGKRAVKRPVGQRPVPRLLLQIFTLTTSPGWTLLRSAPAGPAALRALYAPIASSRVGGLRPELTRLRLGGACCAAADLTHQQLVGADECE